MDTHTLLEMILGPASLGRGTSAHCFATLINQCFCLGSRATVSAKIDSQEGPKSILSNEQQWLTAPKKQKTSNSSRLNSQETWTPPSLRLGNALWKMWGGDLQDAILCSLDVSRGHRNHQLMMTVDAYTWRGPIHSQSWKGEGLMMPHPLPLDCRLVLDSGRKGIAVLSCMITAEPSRLHQLAPQTHGHSQP